MEPLAQAQQLLFCGIALLEEHKPVEALSSFQKCGAMLRSALDSVAQNEEESGRSKESGSVSVLPLLQDAEPIWDAESFLSPFAFLVHATTQDEVVTEHQLSVCTAVLLFNLGVCYQAQGGQDRCLSKARTVYKQAWECLCRSQRQQHCAVSGLEGLQMCISMNLSSCLFALGQLETSHLWSQCLQVLVENQLATSDADEHNDDEEDSSISKDWLRFFHTAAILRARCVAAGAA